MSRLGRYWSGLLVALVSVSCAGGEAGIESPIPADLDDDGYNVNDDCDDARGDVHPGATEQCDGIDNNCDGFADDSPDDDGDGASSCPQGGLPADCVDSNPNINPWQVEVCDRVDNNCDGVVDEGFDLDYDGYTICERFPDCDDSNSAVNPGALEVCDGADNDCDGVTDFPADADGDGVFVCADPSDCDDSNAAVYPGAPESCDGVDNDCNSEVDEGFDMDADGFASCGEHPDCNDHDATINPGNEDICDDGIDQNCDGIVATSSDQDADGYSTCAASPDCDDAQASTNPSAPEQCNAVDDNCDGSIDEGLDSPGAEPADGPISAVDLGVLGEETLEISASLYTAGDEDWYAFAMPSEFDEEVDGLWLELSDIPDNADYDVALVAGDGVTELANSAEPDGETEEITYKAEPNQAFYARVYWKEGSWGCPSYRLKIRLDSSSD